MQIAKTHLIVAAVFFCVFGASYAFLQLRGHLTPLPAEEIEFAVPLRPAQAVPQSSRAKATQVSAVSQATEPTALGTPASELGSVRDRIAAPHSSNIPPSPQAVLDAKPQTAFAVLVRPPPPMPVAKPAIAPLVSATRPPPSASKTVAATSLPRPLPAPAAVQQPTVSDRPAATPALAPLPSDGSDDPPVAVPVRAPPPPAAAIVPAAPSSSPALAPMPDDAEE